MCNDHPCVGNVGTYIDKNGGCELRQVFCTLGVLINRASYGNQRANLNPIGNFDIKKLKYVIRIIII